MKKKIFLQGSVTKSENGRYKIIASTASIDRQGDSIDQAGWDLTNFKSNPVLLWAHDYSSLPIGKIWEIGVNGNQLEAEFEFAPEEANPKAAQIQKLYDGGFVNASSVGLIPKERNGHVITKAELLELSLVPVPANQEALRLAISSKSVDVSLIEKDLEKGEIADQVNVQDTWEKKWENFEKVSDIMSAFWSVYFDEKTGVDEFNKLVSETAKLLSNLSGDTASDDEEKGMIAKSFDPENLSKMVEALIAKSGKKLSKKTVTQIDNSIASMKESISVLEHLKSENDQTESPEEVADEGEQKAVEASEEVVVLSLSEFLKTLQSHVRTSDKANEQTNLLINNVLASRKAK